ncbi:hypothetical protein BCD49_32120 [Pseudofrankia sp. EUN1h]|nr:hypothetical protein BCD49_32120 [Pseudofrankia sp. EUN1h]
MVGVEVTALLKSVPDPRIDVPLMHAVGQVMWHRHLLAGAGADESTFAGAVAVFSHVYPTRPHLVPDPIRKVLDDSRSIPPDGPAAWAFQAASLLQESLRDGGVESLDTAIQLLRRALHRTAQADPNRLDYLTNLRTALSTHHFRTGNLADLDAAVDAAHQAVAAAPPGHADRSSHLSHLAAIAVRRYEMTGSTIDIAVAVDAAGQAVATAPANDPNRHWHLSELGLAVLARHRRTGVADDLELAISTLRNAVAAAPVGGPSWTGGLSNLSMALRNRHERTGNLVDLDDAIVAAAQAVKAIDPAGPGRRTALTNLGVALRARFEVIGDPDDLDGAIDAAEQALEDIADGHPSRGGYLANLGAALRERYERSGNTDDLDAAVAAGRSCVATTVAGDARRLGFLTNFGASLRVRAERTGNLLDLEEAVAIGRASVTETPDGHPDRPRQLSNLAGSLNARFNRTGDGTDLDEAVDAFREAVYATPPDQPAAAGYRSNLAGSLRSRFGRTGRLTDLDEAIDAARAAVNATPDGHENRARCLALVGDVLLARFHRTEQLPDIDEAAAVVRSAIAAAPAGRTARASYQSDLCNVLLRRFRFTWEADDLDAAIVSGSAAVNVTAPDNPARSNYLHILATALRTRFERGGDQEDLEAAIDAGRRAVESDVASPRVRAFAARHWASTAASVGRWPEAMAAYEAAVDLLTYVAGRGLHQTDQEHQLSWLTGIASDAAAVCLRAGRPDRAVELWEHSRGIILGQALDLQTDLTALAEHSPALAERFATARDALDPSRAPVTSTASRRADADRRRQAADVFEKVLAEIRRTAGFARFLRPPSLTDLLSAVGDHPLIVVMVSELGSYALILKNGSPPEPVELPNVNPDEVLRRASALIDGPRGATRSLDRAAAEEQLSDTLSWLWTEIVYPVLDRLGIAAPPPPDRPWPRLRWCASGLLSFLPLHAAGLHGTRSVPSSATLLDRAISSYVPTIRALGHAARPQQSGSQRAAARKGGRLVVVAMQHTPHRAELPSAAREAAALAKRFPGQVKLFADTDATREAVLAALPSARWAHFACHGSFDLGDPSSSGLLLNDHALTVLDLTRLRLDADLAFLSACSTALPGGRTPDEAIHLVTALQLVGYRNVVGTLWPINDQISASVADHVYAALEAGAEMAAAVHQATRALREAHRNRPTAWAAHIHAGA